MVAQARALGIPVDPRRARTHLLIQEVEYMPRERDVRRKFKIVRAGVFRLRDASRGLEKICRLAEGHGEAWVREMVETADSAIPKSFGNAVYYPVIDLSIDRHSQGAYIIIGTPLEEKTMVGLGLMQVGIQRI